MYKIPVYRTLAPQSTVVRYLRNRRASNRTFYVYPLQERLLNYIYSGIWQIFITGMHIASNNETILINRNEYRKYVSFQLILIALRQDE